MNASGTETGNAGVVRPADGVPAAEVVGGAATSIQVLVGPDEGAPNFVMRRFRMEAGGGIPLHTNQVEHEQYVLRGRAHVTIAGEVHDVGPDDTLFIPAGAAHSYEVVESPFEFLCVVPNAPDRLSFVDSPAAGEDA